MRRGLVADLAAARAAVRDGRVTVDGAPTGNPRRQVSPAEAVRLLPAPPRYVGRAGEKLHAALDRFAVDVADRHALDVGSSTGGFTDCLLAHGAASVVAVDVGRAQLHERLRADPRVEVRERTDVRTLDVGSLHPPPTVVTVDVSFLSLRAVVGHLGLAAGPVGDAILLVKPQFEVDDAVVSRGRGVVRDPGAWADALLGVHDALGDAGAAIMAAMSSPVRGAAGNVEFLLHAAPAPVGAPGALDADALAAVARQVEP